MGPSRAEAWYGDAGTKTEPVIGDRYRGTIIDTGRVQIRDCYLSAVSFRSRDEGWATDLCGHAFHTTDGGVSFRPEAASRWEAQGAPHSPECRGRLSVRPAEPERPPA